MLSIKHKLHQSEVCVQSFVKSSFLSSSKRPLQSPTAMYILLQLLDNIRPLCSAITILYSRAPIPLTVNSLWWRVQLGAHLARLKERSESEAFWCRAAQPVCITEREREHFTITSLWNKSTLPLLIIGGVGLTQGAGGVKGRAAHTYRKSSWMLPLKVPHRPTVSSCHSSPACR